MLVLRIHFVTLQRDINFAGTNNIPVLASPIHPGPASSALKVSLPTQIFVPAMVGRSFLLMSSAPESPPGPSQGSS